MVEQDATCDCHKDARLDVHAVEARLVRQRDALLVLSSAKLDCDDLQATLADILEVTAATLDVARVSIWRYSDQATQIECVDLYETSRCRHSHGTVIAERDCPVYFRALAEADVVAADDAISDPRTREFSQSYLRPLGISSMMDVPIHLKGAVIGVLCNEHTGPARRWTEDEKSFAVGIANLVSLALERCERSRAEAALMLQGAALNAAANAVVITDGDGTVVWANAAFTAMTGYSSDEALGRNPRDLLKSDVQPPSFYSEMWSTLKAGRVWDGEIVNRRKDGSTYLEHQTITPVRVAPDSDVTHYVAIKRDLTEQRLLENQFMQAQKMEIVGRLAGGIAHDFNNMLTVINGTAELAIADLPEQHPVRNDLVQIHQSGMRAASLTRQLLTFSRKQLEVRQPLIVMKALTEFRGILQRLIGEDIALEIQAACGDATVLADHSQFEQVILNLAVNARDAMPRGGSLRIAAARVDVDGDRPGLREGRYVRLTVTDTGSGMSAETAARIFEPFFTTKEEGKGTGLGLATVYAVIEQACGKIEVASELGKGTTFTLFWPTVDDASPSSASAPAAAVSRGTGTVLIVEDDELVRDLSLRVLRGAGYRVLTAADATSALALIRTDPWPIDLLLTDVVLPGAGGRELASAASALRPKLQTLYTSGYTDDAVLAHGVEQHIVDFLPKPYTPVGLLNKVRAVLNQSKPVRPN
jgi:PAS domain S-box-containing protein